MLDHPVEEAIVGYGERASPGASSPIRYPLCKDCTNVLLVDDEPLNLCVLSAYLSSIGIHADKAENGQIALNMIEKKAMKECCCPTYKIICMDINMPVMDGIEAVRHIYQNYMERDGKVMPCYIVGVTAAAGLDNPDIYASYVGKGFTELGNCYIQFLRIIILLITLLVSKPVQKVDFIQTLKKYIYF